MKNTLGIISFIAIPKVNANKNHVSYGRIPGATEIVDPYICISWSIPDKE